MGRTGYQKKGETAAIQPPIVDTYLIYFLLKILMIINDFSQSPLALFTWEWVEGHCPSHIRAMQLLAAGTAGRWCSHGGASGARLGLGLFCLGQEDG